MNDSDKKDFANIMYETCDLYGKEASTKLMSKYFELLRQFTVDELKNAFSKHAVDPKHGNFMPKPADITRHIPRSQFGVDEKAELAWSQVMHKVHYVGSRGSLKLDDKQAMAAIRSLGTWNQLCLTKECDMTWKKKEFIKVYNTYERTPIELLPSSLPGLVALQIHKKEKSHAFARIKDGIKQFRLKGE